MNFVKFLSGTVFFGTKGDSKESGQGVTTSPGQNGQGVKWRICGA